MWYYFDISTGVENCNNDLIGCGDLFAFVSGLHRGDFSSSLRTTLNYFKLFVIMVYLALEYCFTYQFRYSINIL